MTANPIDLVYVNSVDVGKSDVRDYAKARIRIRFADVTEVQATDLIGQNRIYVASLKANYDYDSSDTTTAHNGTTVLVSADGARFKPADFVVGGTFLPLSNDGAALGSTSKQFSDLFLASGAAINFNSGDATLTHSSDLLTLAGADLKVQSTTASTSTTTGCGIFSGGLGVAGAGYFGGRISTPGTGGYYFGSVKFADVSGGTYNVIYDPAGVYRYTMDSATLYLDNTTITFRAIDHSTTLAQLTATKLSLLQTTASTSTTTGASTVAGGLGVAENINAGGYINAAAIFKTGGTQVVGTRKTGWAAATGTATRTTFATASVTLPQLAERMKALVDDLIGHGLIGA